MRMFVCLSQRFFDKCLLIFTENAAVGFVRFESSSQEKKLPSNSNVAASQMRLGMKTDNDAPDQMTESITYCMVWVNDQFLV